MKYRLDLHYVRDPELVAIRFDKTYNLNGLISQCLRAFINNEEFEIYLHPNARFQKQPLTLYYQLDDEKDADIIKFLNSILIPKTTFVRNLMLRYIKGDISWVYKNEELKALSKTEDDKTYQKEKSVTMTQKLNMTAESEKSDNSKAESYADEDLYEILQKLGG